MMKLIQKIILTSVMCVPSLTYAGQHSGLGGGAPPTPKPAPDPTLFETIEQYYNVYYQWLREQTEVDYQKPTLNEVKKG